MNVQSSHWRISVQHHVLGLKARGLLLAGLAGDGRRGSGRLWLQALGRAGQAVDDRHKAGRCVSAVLRPFCTNGDHVKL